MVARVGGPHVLRLETSEADRTLRGILVATARLVLLPELRRVLRRLTVLHLPFALVVFLAGLALRLPVCKYKS